MSLLKTWPNPTLRSMMTAMQPQRHSGHQFCIDNQHVFVLYKQLIINGLSLAYTKAHARVRDGHEAHLSVQCQAIGTAANTLKKKLTYNQILTAKYNGQGHFSFQAFVHHHQKVHYILADLEKPVPETKKVTEFMNGISVREQDLAMCFPIFEW